MTPTSTLIRIIFPPGIGFFKVNAIKNFGQLLRGDIILPWAIGTAVVLLHVLMHEELLIELEVPLVHLLDDS